MLATKRQTLTRLWQGCRACGGSATRIAVLLIAISLPCASAGAGPLRDPRLGHVHTWAFAIGDGDLRGRLESRYRAYDLLVLDGQGASRAQVRALRRAGKIVLAYLDVGTIEPGRPWYRALKRFRLDYLPDWGEWYADVGRGGYRRAIARRIAPRILSKGFDGLFLDNTDMIESHPRKSRGMRALVFSLSRLVHRRGKLLFSQNGERTIRSTLPFYDGWNREDVSATYDFAAHRYVRQPPAEVAEAARAAPDPRSGSAYACHRLHGPG